MSATFETYELRQVQEVSQVTAADAVVMLLGYPGVPGNKFWTILSMAYKPSVAETKIISCDKTTRTGKVSGLINPVSLLLNPAVFTACEQGMTMILLPGEYLQVRRDTATAGSTMIGIMQFIESDLPFAAYVEQLKKVVLTSRKHGAVYRSIGGGVTGPGGTPPSPGHGMVEGGGGGGGEPVV